MRIYGRWAGHPEGVKEDLERCVKGVYSSFIEHQCRRKRGHGPNGEYCKQHAKSAHETTPEDL